MEAQLLRRAERGDVHMFRGAEAEVKPLTLLGIWQFRASYGIRGEENN